MLFNSFLFLCGFLPITCLLFWQLGRRSRSFAVAWLVLASLVFYGWWNPAYVLLLAGSIVFNYLAGLGINEQRLKGKIRRSTLFLVIALTVDLLILAYYKYASFFVHSFADATGQNWSVAAIALPLGISFFTFTQIAFLVDTWRGRVDSFNPIDYALFVTYFPHLIAGPILHHGEMMRQFSAPWMGIFNADNVAAGATIIVIGLFKKVAIADAVARYSDPVFAAALTSPISLLEAWGGAIAYTLQIYFDFSGYSDMAIGLSILFGIRIPLNFNSPYKARNIVDFWRRWHISLSRFLRDYLYIPLGGNRQGKAHRYVNLMLTMLLGGLWHGAGWTFILWGGLHGIYLVVNHLWQWLTSNRKPMAPSFLRRAIAQLITFLAVVIAWVFFRAESLVAARHILAGMFGFNGIVLLDSWETKLGKLAGWLTAHHVTFEALPLFGGRVQISYILLLLAFVWLLPNTRQLFQRRDIAFGDYAPLSGLSVRLAWKPSLTFAVITACVFSYCLITMYFSSGTEFIYYNF